MRDAIGGSANLVLIVFFIVFVMGYMAFNVNYTKAFRMKNKIISVYEEYNGKCNSSCEEEIRKYANSIGYFTDNTVRLCPDDYREHPEGIPLYCVKQMEVKSRYDQSETGSVDEKRDKVYFKIVTKIQISIPVLKNLIDLNVFKVTGDTKAMIIEDDAETT